MISLRNNQISIPRQNINICMVRIHDIPSRWLYSITVRLSGRIVSVNWKRAIIVSLFFISKGLTGQFFCIPLGTSGGLTDDNLSSYLIGAGGYDHAICLDAGTLYAGICRAYAMGSFSDLDIPETDTLRPEGWILRHYIKAYAISHAHLDHFSGLVMASVEDSPKSVYGSATTIEYLKNNIFNWQIWPNFGNEGLPYLLGKYSYHVLYPYQPVEITGTGLKISCFTLSHSEPYQSTAFLLESNGQYLLYIGDTGPDEVEQASRLDSLWIYIAPLIREGKMNAIFLEVSYPDGIPDSKLYGHLTPAWHMNELTRLAQKTNPQDYRSALHGMNIVVTGIKPSLKTGIAHPEIILGELQAKNNLGIYFIIPEQGKKYLFGDNR